MLRESFQTADSAGVLGLVRPTLSDRGRSNLDFQPEGGAAHAKTASPELPASPLIRSRLRTNQTGFGDRRVKGRHVRRSVMRRRSPRVLLVLGWYDYRLHRGIERFAQERGWHLSEDLAREKVIPWGWDGDGILAWLGAGEDLADFVINAEKPTVDFSFRRPQLPFTRVLEDTNETARLVADHFLSRGFRHFVFYSDVHNWVYEERGAAFLKILEQAGRGASWLCWHESSSYCSGRRAWARKRSWLACKLKSLPKPVGVFAGSDGLALELLEICEESSIAVPEHVGVGRHD